tara:strand:+ start:178 stop:555 length:378 start_codon:yes stop_codon:yes gene_type:complete
VAEEEEEEEEEENAWREETLVRVDDSRQAMEGFLPDRTARRQAVLTSRNRPRRRSERRSECRDDSTECGSLVTRVRSVLSSFSSFSSSSPSSTTDTSTLSRVSAARSNTTHARSDIRRCGLAANR